MLANNNGPFAVHKWMTMFMRPSDNLLNGPIATFAALDDAVSFAFTKCDGLNYVVVHDNAGKGVYCYDQNKRPIELK